MFRHGTVLPNFKLTASGLLAADGSESAGSVFGKVTSQADLRCTLWNLLVYFHSVRIIGFW